MSAAYAEPNPVAQHPFEHARTFGDEVERSLCETRMLKATPAEVEAFVDTKGREWARLLLEAQFALRAAQERRVEVIGADGVERVAVRETERHLETVVGRVVVSRLGYQAPGCVDLHPMDAQLSLPRELYSLGVRRMVAKESARASFDEVVELIADYSGAQIAKRQVEQLAVGAAMDFDAFYAQGRVDEGDERGLMVISTDGKGIVMRHETCAKPLAWLQGRA